MSPEPMLEIAVAPARGVCGSSMACQERGGGEMGPSRSRGSPASRRDSASRSPAQASGRPSVSAASVAGAQQAALADWQREPPGSGAWTPSRLVAVTWRAVCGGALADAAETPADAPPKANAKTTARRSSAIAIRLMGRMKRAGARAALTRVKYGEAHISRAGTNRTISRTARPPPLIFAGDGRCRHRRRRSWSCA